ncbi:unnamed protein product [Brachionus calyciflorus]|uniref:FYVE-type zinc finger domain-containing protein n=1 Tax=Brachionus calyciflorus TaxID=104777 RepID=A0A813TQQ8_9BILA|nr:unnamed protein product [Brachionus calyciflorus]
MILADSIVDDFPKFVTSTPISNSLITNDEYNIINQVLQKDLKLREVESIRLRKMSDEILMELNREKLFQKNKNLNETNCIRCLSTFILILNPKRVCIICNCKICKKCSQLVKNKWATRKLDPRRKNFICYVCFKQKIFETSFWFNENFNYKLADTLDDLSFKFSSISSLRSSKHSFYEFELNKYRTPDHEAFIYENINGIPQNSTSSSILYLL